MPPPQHPAIRTGAPAAEPEQACEERAPAGHDGAAVSADASADASAHAATEDANDNEYVPSEGTPSQDSPATEGSSCS